MLYNRSSCLLLHLFFISNFNFCQCFPLFVPHIFIFTNFSFISPFLSCPLLSSSAPNLFAYLYLPPQPYRSSLSLPLTQSRQPY